MKVGGRYRVGASEQIEVSALHMLSVSSLTPHDARDAGFESLEALRAAIGDRAGNAADDRIYRIDFHHVGKWRDCSGADRAELTDSEVTEIERRLERMDSRSATGPWTRSVLELIEQSPGRRAADLAELLGRDRQRFKADVRKLKGLGLTLSQAVGYRPRGRVFLARRS